MRHRGLSQALLALLAANIAPAGVDAAFCLFSLNTPWLPLASGLSRCRARSSDGALTRLSVANAGGRPGFWGKTQTIQWGVRDSPTPHRVIAPEAAPMHSQQVRHV